MGLSRSVLVAMACLVMVGCTSTDWETRYRDKERLATELGSDLENARHDQAKLQAGNLVLADQLARARADSDRLAAELGDLRTQLDQAMVAPAAPEPAVDIQDLKRKMEFGDIKLDESGNVVITLESGITFSPGSARLTTSGQGILNRVARTLQSDFAGRKIRLIGHTDSDPIKKSGFADNWALGFERARAVAVYFRDEGKIPAENLDLMSRGPHEPVASNESDTGKKKNRRVEVVVVLPEADAASYR
jgi:flagellar motor protein MotB